MSNGLSDGQQSILAAVSILLAALGGLSIPAGAPWYVGLCISAFGALGFAVKEVLGTKDGQKQQQQQDSRPSSTINLQIPKEVFENKTTLPTPPPPPTVASLNPAWNPDQIKTWEAMFNGDELARIKAAPDPEHMGTLDMAPSKVLPAVYLWGFYHGGLPMRAAT